MTNINKLKCKSKRTAILMSGVMLLSGMADYSNMGNIVNADGEKAIFTMPVEEVANGELSVIDTSFYGIPANDEQKNISFSGGRLYANATLKINMVNVLQDAFTVEGENVGSLDFVAIACRDDDIKEYLTEDEIAANKDKISDTYTIDDYNSKIVVYAKPKDSKELAKAKKADSFYDYSKVVYTKQCVYNFNDLLFGEGAGWYKGGDRLDEGIYTNSARLEPMLYGDNILAGTVKYAVVAYHKGQIYSDAFVTSADIGWVSEVQNLESFVDGEYIGLIGYFDDDKLVDYRKYAITKETVAPYFGLAKLVVGDATSYEMLELSDNEGNIFISEMPSGNNYALVIETADDASGVDRIEYTIGETTETIEGNYIPLESLNEEVVVTVYDKCGNNSSQRYFVGYDADKPLISDVTINGEAEFDNSKKLNEFILSATITDEGVSGLDFDKVNVNVKKNGEDISLANGVYDLQTIEGTNQIKLNYSLNNDNTMSGVYSFYITAGDKAGNYSEQYEIENVYIDFVRPVTKDAKLVFREIGTKEWHDLNVNTQPYINNCNYYEYAYEVVAADDCDDIVKVEGKIDESEIVACTQENGKFYFTVNDNSLEPGEHTATLIATDEVGNAEDGKRYSFIVANDQLQIDSDFVIIDSNGKEETIEEMPSHTSEAYKIVVSANSGYKINNATFSIENEYGEMTNYGVDNTITNEFKETLGRFESQFTVNIPEKTDINILMKNGMITLYDEKGNSITMSIGTMLFDQSKPRVVNSKVVVNGDSSIPFEEDKWYKSAEIIYDIDAGAYSNNSELETILSNISYNVISDGREFDSYVENGIDAVNYHGQTADIQESMNLYGTVVAFNACDLAGNMMDSSSDKNKVVLHIDKTSPVVDAIEINYGQNDVPLAIIPEITVGVSDNLTLDRVTATVTYPDGTKKSVDIEGATGSEVGITRNNEVPIFEGVTSIPNGEYIVEVVAVDKAGNEGRKIEKFSMDSTSPLVTAKIVSGVEGGKTPTRNFDGTPCDYYYRSAVGVQLTFEDNNIDIQDVTVTDNDKVLSVNWVYDPIYSRYLGNIVIDEAGTHNIQINAMDRAGNRALEKNISFIIDVDAPILITTINSLYSYTRGMETMYMASDAFIDVAVEDMNRDDNDLNIRIVKKLPDIPTDNPRFVNTTDRRFSFADEADYSVYIYAVDRAGNISETQEINFRIDKTAPVLSIGGIGEGGKSSTGVNLSMGIEEAFHWDADGKATIYRRAGDGQQETLLKTIDLKPTSSKFSLSEALMETGEYRVELEAVDKVGHSARMSQSFLIDTEKPEIKLGGVNNYDLTDKDVNFFAQIADIFYTGKTVFIRGTRKDIDGNVHDIVFDGYSNSQNPTTISKIFGEDGIYDIQVDSTDIVGNKSSSNVHFVVDKTAPIISDLPIKEGEVINEFSLNVDPDTYVNDLTICDVNMYVNGSEYDGSDIIEDGAYTLSIVAKDELGHESSKKTSFVLDTKAPVFIIDGVEDGEAKEEEYNIKIALQFKEDTLLGVALNDKNIPISDGTATLNVKDQGSYILQLKAIDKAGNIAEKTITFRYGKKNQENNNDSNIYIIILGVMCCVASIFVFARRKRKKQ